MQKQASKSQNPKMVEEKLSAFQEYLYVNLLFWSFLVMVAVISFFTCGAVWDDVTSGVMEFLFLIMGGGFTLVSILDFNYEKYLVNPAAEGKNEKTTK